MKIKNLLSAFRKFMEYVKTDEFPADDPNVPHHSLLALYSMCNIFTTVLCLAVTTCSQSMSIWWLACIIVAGIMLTIVFYKHCPRAWKGAVEKVAITLFCIEFFFVATLLIICLAIHFLDIQVDMPSLMRVNHILFG